MVLPITISTSNGFRAPNGGPWESGTSFYILGTDGGNTIGGITIYKADSDDPASGWTAQDTAGEPTGTDGIASMHAVLGGTDIHLITQDSGGLDIEYHIFHCATNLWDGTVVEESVTTAPDGSIGFCSVGVRSDGDVITAYNGEQQANMGTGYDRIDLARREGGTWTTDISVDNLGKTTTHMRYPFVVMSANDRAHISYHDASGQDVHYSTYLSGNTWGHQHTEVDAAASGVAIPAHAAKGFRFDDGGTEKIRFFYRDSPTTDLSVFGFDDADDPGSSVSIATDINSSGNNLIATSGTAVVVDDSNDTQYYLHSDETSGDIQFNSTGSGDDTWGTAEDELASLSNPTVYSANVYDNGGTVLAYLYKDGSNYRYNERSLGAAATPQSLNATAIGTASFVLVKTFLETLASTAVGTATIATATTFLKSLGAGAIGTATFLKQVSKTLASTATGAASFLLDVTHLVVLSVTSAVVATLAALQVVGQVLASSAVGSPTLTSILTFARTLAPTAVGTASLGALTTFLRTLAPTAIGTATLGTLTTYLRTLSVSGIGTATLTAVKEAVVNLVSSAIGTASLATVTTFLRTLSVTSTVSATFAKLISISLLAGATGIATLNRVVTFLRTLSVTAVGTPSITDVFCYLKSLTSSAIGTATLTPATLILQVLNSVATGTATVATSITTAFSMVATAIGTSSFVKKITKTLNAAAVGTGILSTLLTKGVSMTATAIGTATLTASKLILQTLNSIAVGTANLIATFIPGVPPIVAGIKRVIKIQLMKWI